MDGWGIGPAWGGNAIMSADTPNIDIWWRSYARTTLFAASEAVGLPPETAGNSETGHLNIGAGRAVPQDLEYINQKIADGSFEKNAKILAVFEHVKKNNSCLHLLGLASTGHVHSDLNHLFCLIKMAKASGVTNICLDLFTDGRDSDPNSALQIFENINRYLSDIGVGRVNFICGRFFAMDRDKNWGRTSRFYNALTKGEANSSPTARNIISQAYVKSISDEFIEPCFIGAENNKCLISDNDAVVLFNFRPDRVRQLSLVFTGAEIPEMADRKILKNLYFLTFVNRDPKPIGIPVFETAPIKNTLSEVLSSSGLTQFHLAETEKYAHVSYFFDGGREVPFPGEVRLMIPSPKVKTYDLAPKMSAQKITDTAIANLNKNFNFVILNYANADMVGHSGNFYSTVQAIEFVDQCLGKLIKYLSIHNYTTIITADHGNAEEMINPATKSPQTEHTKNPVPFLVISKEIGIAKARVKNGGALCDIAPTILDLMDIPKPAEMTADSLIFKGYGTK